MALHVYTHDLFDAATWRAAAAPAAPYLAGIAAAAVLLGVAKRAGRRAGRSKTD